MMGVKMPETCRVTWQWNKLDCKQLHLVDYLKEYYTTKQKESSENRRFTQEFEKCLNLKTKEMDALLCITLNTANKSKLKTDITRARYILHSYEWHFVLTCCP